MSRNIATIFIVALLFGAHTVAFAQESTVNGTVDGEADSPAVSAVVTGDDSLDFVVTAGRTREAANKVAGQVTVITADDIAESGATSVTEILATVPGVNFSRSMSGDGLQISMRGIGTETSHGKVLIIMDGMTLNGIERSTPINWNVINLSDVERIEVLDGSAAVQYGSNALTGVINIITKKSGAAKTDVTISAGSFYQNEERFSHHRPTEWGGFTLSGGHRGTQGFQKNSGSDTSNGELRGILDLSDAMSLQANFAFSQTSYKFASALTQAQFDEDPTQMISALQLGHGGARFELLSGAAFAWTMNETLNLDLPLSYRWTQSDYNTLSDYGYGLSSNATKKSTHGAELKPKLSAAFKPANMDLRLVGGIDLLTVFAYGTVFQDATEKLTPFDWDQSHIAVAPWVSASLKPTSFLSFNAGVRYDSAFLTAKMNEYQGAAEESSSKDWQAFVYEVGLAYNPLDFMKVYIKHSSVFHYPFIDDFTTLYPGYTSFNQDMKPEKGYDVEGGVDVDFNKVVKLKANLYYLYLEDEVAYYRDPVTNNWNNLNMDPINRIGTDISVTITPIKYFDVYVGYGFVNAQFASGTQFEGNSVPLVPEHKLSASLMIHTPIGISLGPDIVYKSEMQPGNDFSHRFPAVAAYTLVGLSARYVIKKDSGEFAVQLRMHNLGDVSYATMVYASSNPTSDAYLIYPDSDMGRSFNISLQYRY
jgi:iron complex outermembrane receptor protein